jgi:hypothetical protein
MSRAFEYRRRAEECSRLAESVQAAELKAQYTYMANAWIRLAIEAEKEAAADRDAGAVRPEQPGRQTQQQQEQQQQAKKLDD